MSKIFVTGVAGFLGSHIADTMLAEGHSVAGNDNMIGGENANIPNGVRFYGVDCCNFGDMKNAMVGAEVVFHCAATAYEGLSVFSPSVVSRNIVDASVTTFAAAIANKVKRVVHCSSMARYGEQPPPFYEHMTPRPQDPYGIAKVCAEQMLRNLCDTHGMEYVIAVPHNIIGPRQKYDDPYRNVASIMMGRILNGAYPIIYGSGEQRRCFSFVDDCLACLTKMAFQPDLHRCVINIGPDEEPVTINELFRIIAEVTGFKGEPYYVPGRPQEVRVALCSSRKARQLLGYETKTTLQMGLRKMWAAMQERGPREFKYHLPLEIITDKTPVTWTKRYF